MNTDGRELSVWDVWVIRAVAKVGEQVVAAT